MKTKLLLGLLLLLISNATSAQTISIIGDTSPSGSWTTDTFLTTTDNINYTLNNVVLTTATGPSTGLNFRQDSSWTINWGGTFPNGVGQQDGPNIQTVAGTYNITFNRSNGTYTFISTALIPSIGIWGPAVDSQNGYAGPDVDMATSDGVTYKLNDFIFSSGNAYFRQDNNGTLVWGSTSFPTGTAVASGPSLFIPGGEWNVTFNRTTGEYSFVYPTVGILGTALGGFNVDDTNLSTTDGFIYTISNLSLTDGLVKFRKNDSWSVNWGSTGFPTGVGTQNGPDIPVVAGLYDITFDRSTGNYQFNQLLSTNDFDSVSFGAFPNPSSNNWTVTSSETINRIELIDIVGETIQQLEPKTKEYVLEGAYLLNGIYLAKVTTDWGTKTIKLVKK